MQNPLNRALKALKEPWTMATKSLPPVLSVDLLDSGNYDRGTIKQPGFFMTPTMERFFTFSGRNSVVAAYQKCPPVSAIVHRKAQAYGNGKIWVTDEDGEEVTTDVANRLRKLLRRPNPLQTWTDFEAQGYVLQQLFGYCPILAIKPAGFKENIYAKSLWNIPPTMVKIEEAEGLFTTITTISDMIKSITLTYKDHETPLEKADVLILRDVTISTKSLLLPDSRLKALALPVNNVIGAYESRNVLINYRGALGILSPEKDQFGVAPIDPDDKVELQNDFLRYGLTNDQWKFIISSAALKWQPMGIAPKELMLLEEVIDSTKAICDGYNYPPQLLAIIDPKYDNWDAAEKGLYQNAIMPEAQRNTQQWNEFFDTDKHKLIIWKDFDHVAALQNDKVKEAQARMTLNQAKQIEWENDLITLNQWLESLDEEPLEEGGDLRRSQITQSSGPLAVAIGVGGVQGLISVITAQGMTAEAKQATIEILFGIAPADAARMVAEGAPAPTITTEPPPVIPAI